MVATMIAAGASWLAGATGMSLAYATFAVNFALSMVVSRIFADNPETQQDMGVRQQVPPSAVNAIPIVYGNAYMGGTFVDAVLTTDQKTMYYVLAISSISPNGQFTYDTADMYFGDRLISFASSGSVQSARIFNGGSGYVVGDVLTISGGSFTTAAVFTVSEVSTGGVITAANLTTAGSYTSAPANPAISTGGTGTGASAVLKYSSFTNTVIALSDEAGNVNTKINGNLYINLYTSNATGTIVSANGADAPTVVMGGSDIAAEQRWVSTFSAPRKMNGLAFVIVKMIYNRDADTTQLSPITFKVSHTLNGTGVAKAGDVWYDYITNSVYGGAVDVAFVNSTSATALNTYGDQTITFTNSSGSPATQARYRINGVLDAGQSVLSNIDRIMSACDSWMTYNAALGQWSVVVNKAESTSYAFTDNNIIGEIRVSATDITTSINQVEARFPFKDNRDQAAFVNIETPSGLLYPNEPVNKYSITYDMVNDSVQASYLANRLLEQAREDLIVGFSTTYYGIQVDAGDVVSVTNSDYGWNAKLFRVMKVNEASLPDGSLGAKLELSEYNAAVYDDATIQQFTPVPNSGLPSVSYFSPLAAPTVTGFPSATIPYINVQVFVPTTGRVTFGNLFWTTSATPTSADWKLVTSASTTDGQPLTNGTYYTFSNITLNTGTYYFAYNVGNDITSSILSPISAALVWNPVAASGPFVDISGFTGFSKNAAGTVITPASSVLTAVVQNVTSPTYAWTITGATPTTGSASTITITPSLAASSVTASLTVNGSNLTTPIVRTITMPITLDGTGTAGLNSATVYLYNKNTTTTPPALFSGTFTYTFTSGVLSGGTLNGWSQTPPAIAAGEFLFLSLATASSTAATDTVPTSEFSTPQVISGTGTNGTDANKFATAFLYQWYTASTAPSNPSGSSTYTWSSGAGSGYTGGGGWSDTVPTNPGTSGVALWVVSKQVTDVSTAVTTTVSWTSGYAKYVAGQNGDSVPGTQAARPTVYAWSLAPAPTLTGTTEFYWATGIYAPPAGWSTTITAAPSSGYNLYAATVSLVAGGTATQTTINWNTATVIIQSVSNFDGSSARICYTKTTLTNLASSPSTITTSGSASFPPNDSWGAGTIWQATPPSIVAGESVYQSDGVYSPVTLNTVWNVPYLSALRVGNLSAISANTGSLTVTGTFQSNTAAISGTTMTGSGGVLYSTGNFAFGNSTANIAYNGSALTLNGLANKSVNNNTASANINLYSVGSAYYYNLLTMTKANGVTGIMQCSTSFLVQTSYPNASYAVITIFVYAVGNNGWLASLGTYRSEQVLNGTASVYPAVREFAFPLNWHFLFNTNDFGSGAANATSINLTFQYTASYYDSSSTLLTSAPYIGDIIILGANTSFYQPLLGS